MSWKDYPALSERCYLETLPNGLRLRVVPKPGFAGKFAFLGVNFGSCDTQLPQSSGWQTVPDGTAHFLEHRMFCLPDCDPETEGKPAMGLKTRKTKNRTNKYIFKHRNAK